MAAVSYSPTTYNKLPDLAAAGADFDAKNGDDLIPSFRELFLRHNLDRVFGLSLLHRHFDMEPHERLVEYRGTSVPWAQSLAKSAKPTNWVLEEDDGFRPFEFHYSLEDAADTPDSPQDPKYATFIKDFKELLEQKNAADLFGLCSYPGDDFEGRVEITEARANINLLPKDVSRTRSKNFVYRC
ncbi:hypothetical protein F4779DRAFT_448368 [Xylariaceae sp. FL0662B]|nr:hypothetical protein F4779DRAFT_448368 [Xylariaceae sp. FL0662B]